VVVWGASQSGKSFLMLDVSLCMTHGMDWHGHRTVQGAVAYIVAEGARGAGKRVKAWKRHHGVTHTKSPFVVIPTAVNFADEEEVARLIEQLRRIERENELKFRMVVIDTLAKCMKGGEENSAKEMGLALAHADRVREKLKSVVCIVHHCGKDVDRGPRGSYALFAGVNTSIYVERNRQDHVVAVTVDKQKDDSDDVVVRLRIKKIDLPLRPGEEPESSLVFEDYRLDCRKATPMPEEGMTIDRRYADLMTIATIMPDNGRSSVTSVAEFAFRSNRLRDRVREAVPMEWIEVRTNFDLRHVRRVQPTDSDHQFIECRHVTEPTV
jgi:hypothetical protein